MKNTSTGRQKLLIAMLSMPIAFLALSEAAEPLDKLLINPDIWSGKPDAFMESARPLGFRWVSNTKDSARNAARGTTFMGEPVLETVVRFDTNGIDNVMLSFYNRGDAGEMPVAVFQKKVETITSNLTALAGSKGKPVSSFGPVKVNIKTTTLVWTKDDISYILESSYTRTKQLSPERTPDLPEYINLTLTRGGFQSVQKLAGDQRVGINLLELKKKVVKTSDGDVYIDNIPMIDQGRKGYCANAATERVMRYYGIEVNQHELAQKALTATGGGTSPDALLTALKAMTGLLNLRVSIIRQQGVNDFLTMVQDYNRFARRAGKDEINVPTSGTIDVSQIYRAMDKTIYLKMRLNNSSFVEQFNKSVKEKTNNGLPVIWCVILGFVAEKPELPQAFGGHMRLIIGYNDKTSEILYSDTWGPGHESKRMKLSDAYAITTGVFTLEPLR